jgi:hypothetical protein
MSEQEDNGLTLQGLAQRLETQAQRLERLERENERMRSENAELRGTVSALRASGTHREEVVTLRGSETPRGGEEAPATEEFAGRVSRRALLSKAGAAALGALAAGTLLNPHEAKANHVYGHHASISANRVKTHTLEAENNLDLPGVPAIWGRSMEKQGPGVSGRTSATNYSAVRGVHEGLVGFGVAGHGRGQDGAGVLGQNADGYGVIGRSSGGIGGRFEGSRAQLRLVPGPSAGKPAGAHSKGELYMDSAATLFVCTAEGTPGTWRQVTTTPA